MQMPSIVQLTDCRTDAVVEAEVESLEREAAKGLSTKWNVENWWAISGELIGSIEDEPDFHWDWVALVSNVQNKPTWRAVCVWTPDRQIQGAMLYRIGVASAINPNQKAIFVDRLATAPANREQLVREPIYRGVGEGLIRFAIAESWLYGLGGRVSLFPIASHEFYVNRGFRPTDVTDSVGTDVMYEITAVDAEAYLRKQGML